MKPKIVLDFKKIEDIDFLLSNIPISSQDIVRRISDVLKSGIVKEIKKDG